MEQPNEQPIEPVESSKNIWITVVAVIITTLIVGGGVYVWQRSNLKNTEQSLGRQISVLQNQINQLKQVQENEQTNNLIVEQKENTVTDNDEPSSSQPMDPTSYGETYHNDQYGFKFALPTSWNGYSIVTSEWEGYVPGNPRGDITTERGPMILIRHPQYTSQNPRQDIPIMVFTTTQWNSLQQGNFHIGAAPVNPSELGHNAKYVFALPARYNYAFLTGYEEVDEIFRGSPLQVF